MNAVLYSLACYTYLKENRINVKISFHKRIHSVFNGDQDYKCCFCNLLSERYAFIYFEWEGERWNKEVESDKKDIFIELLCRTHLEVMTSTTLNSPVLKLSVQG